MIPTGQPLHTIDDCKPRASGDDPARAEAPAETTT